jgi:hypothetical protein
MAPASTRLKVRETPRHHAMAALQEQDILLELAELLFELLANGRPMYLIQRRLAT